MRVKTEAEKYIKSLSDEELRQMEKDCLRFWDSGILPEGLFKNAIRKKQMSETIFSEGVQIQFIINILTHEVFSRNTNF